MEDKKNTVAKTPDATNLLHFKAGAYITLEGKDLGTSFFIIRKGRVQLTRNKHFFQEGEERILEAGGIFGVVSALSSHNYMETAFALTDIDLLQVKAALYGQFVQQNPNLAQSVLLHLSRRKRLLINGLEREILGKTNPEGEAQLYQTAESYSLQGLFEPAYRAYSLYIMYYPNGEKVNDAKDHLQKITARVKFANLNFKPEENSRSYPKDSVIFTEGEPGDELYIIQSGMVKASKVTDTGEVMLAILRPGAIFGEMAVLERHARTYTAIVLQDSIILTIQKAEFQEWLRARPQFVSLLSVQMAGRIWLYYKQLDYCRMEDPVARVYNALLVQLQEERVPLQFPEAHNFDFGVKELLDLAGVSQKEGTQALRDLSQSTQIMLGQTNIHISDVTEIYRRCEYLRKVQRLGEKK
jgi:CRP-like cAMP-binding protein